jgi:hypothetical protein
MSGVVKADFLDEAVDDLISIERQRIDWVHPDARPLLEWGKSRVRELLKIWNELRVEEKIRQLDQKIAPFSERLERLPQRERRIVERAVRNFAQIRALTQDQFRTLSEATLTAWEGGRLHELIDDIAQAGDMSEGDLLEILAEHQVLTALHTAEAVKAKRDVVAGLSERIQRRELENAVCNYIATNPWLIDPKWETFRVETSLKKIVGETAKARFSEEMLAGRVDLVLASGEQLVVLEFMRPELKLDRDHLSRFDYYVNTLRANVRANTGGPYRTVIGYIVADRIVDDLALVETIETMRANGKFAIEWDKLLAQAARHWGEFFEALAERAPMIHGYVRWRAAAHPRCWSPRRAKNRISRSHQPHSLGRRVGARRPPLRVFAPLLAPVSLPFHDPREAGHGRHHAGRCGFRIFVLPDANDCPTGVKQPAVGVAVPRSVTLDLSAPPVRVGYGPRHVNRASVPKAAVNENGNPCAWKHEIRPSAQLWDRPNVHAVAETASMQFRSKAHLWRGVASANAAEASRRLG